MACSTHGKVPGAPEPAAGLEDSASVVVRQVKYSLLIPSRQRSVTQSHHPSGYYPQGAAIHEGAVLFHHLAVPDQKNQCSYPSAHQPIA